MSFGADINRFTLKVKGKNKAVFTNSVAAVQDSIQNGSAVTGSPGQPKLTGNLALSYQSEFLSATEARVSTNVEYALPIEEGISRHGTPITYQQGPPDHSSVGGPHSVAMTVQNFDKLVDDEVKKLGDAAA